MKVLIINGSGKGKASGTLKVANAFAKGIKGAVDPEDDKVKVETVTLADMNIHFCNRCFECFKGTKDGYCIYDDDMAGIVKKYVDADVVIWSFPLCDYAMSALAKTCLERLICVQSVLSKSQEKDGFHEARPIGYKRFVLCCASNTIDQPNQFEPIINQFNLMYPRYTKILVGQGAVLTMPKAENFIKPFLSKVENAGAEFVKNGTLSNSTEGEISGLVMPRDTYMQIAGD